MTIGNIAYDVETIVNDIRLPMTNKTIPMTMTVNIRLPMTNKTMPMPMTVNERLLPMTMTRTIVANQLWLLTMRIIIYDYEHKAIIYDHDLETITVNCLWLLPRTILDN